MTTTFYSMTRGSGKTTKLIHESARTGAIIVTATRPMAAHVVLQAKKLDLMIPQPITVRDYIQIFKNDGLCGDQKYLIDDLELVLRVMNVSAATVNYNCVVDDFKALKSTTGSESKLHSDVKVGTELIPTY